MWGRSEYTLTVCAGEGNHFHGWLLFVQKFPGRSSVRESRAGKLLIRWVVGSGWSE